jgi:hypothetical protein
VASARPAANSGQSPILKRKSAQPRQSEPICGYDANTSSVPPNASSPRFFAHPREVMRGFMAEEQVTHPVAGWYVMRHVQYVIGAGFDDIAPVSTIARVQCPVLVVHGM